MTNLSCWNKVKLHLARPNFTRSRRLYRFGDDDRSCIISFGNTQFAIIEEINRTSNQIQVGHFSVNAPYRSHCIGEPCLRKFSARIGAIDQTVQSIAFDLYRAPTNADHKKIGSARAKLLGRIGATDVSVSIVGPPGNERVNVKGLWKRDKW